MAKMKVAMDEQTQEYVEGYATEREIPVEDAVARLVKTGYHRLWTLERYNDKIKSGEKEAPPSMRKKPKAAAKSKGKAKAKSTTKAAASEEAPKAKKLGGKLTKKSGGLKKGKGLLGNKLRREAEPALEMDDE